MNKYTHILQTANGNQFVYTNMANDMQSAKRNVKKVTNCKIVSTTDAAL